MDSCDKNSVHRIIAQGNLLAKVERKRGGDEAKQEDVRK
jgi:hypothetical protein